MFIIYFQYAIDVKCISDDKSWLQELISKIIPANDPTIYVYTMTV